MKIMERDAAQLMALINSCETVEDFTNHAVELLGNPMLVFDFNMRVIAGTPIDAGNQDYDQVRTTRYAAPTLADSEQWRQNMKQLWQRKDAHIEIFRGEQHLSKILRLNDTAVGQIDSVSLLRPFTEEDLAVAELISYPLTVKLYSQMALNAPRKSELDYCLEYLLDGNTISEEAVRARASMAGWKPGNYLYVLCANSFEQGLDYRATRFETLLGAGDVMLRYRAYMVMIFSRKNRLEGESREQLEQQLRQERIPCGLSLAFHSLADVKCAFDQACAALDAGERVSEGEMLHCYDHYVPYDLIRECSRTTDLNRFLTGRVKELTETDRSQQLGLLKTLRVYLYQGRSVQRTAEELHIHRNTVSYRIGKALDLLGVELSDSRRVLQLATMIEILEYLDRDKYFS